MARFLIQLAAGLGKRCDDAGSVDGFAGAGDGSSWRGRERARDCGGAEHQPIERGEVVQAAFDHRQRSAGPDRGYVAPKIAGTHRDWLIERTRAEPFTLRGLVLELADRGLKVDDRTVWKFVHREGLSFKKNRAGQRAGPAGRGAQADAVEDLPGPGRSAPPGVHRRNAVRRSQTWAKTNMARCGAGRPGDSDYGRRSRSATGRP